MLTPEYLLHISEGAEEIAEQLHRDIINRIVERLMLRIGRGDKYILTATDKWQIQILQDAGYLLEDIQKEIIKRTRQQEQEIKEAMEDAGIKSLSYDEKIYQAAGLSPIPLMQSPHLIRLMQRNYESTLGEWKNYTRTTAEASQKAFISALDKAYILTASGAVSYTQSVKEAVEEVAKNGVYVEYRSKNTGDIRRDTIETATLRAVRTGISQSTAQITLKRMEEMKWGIVLVSAHLGARNVGGAPENHELWQGQFYSLPQFDHTFPDFYYQTGYGDITGLCGVNCRHSFGPGDGKNNPYKEINTEENAKAYEMQQRQRELERRIRKTKREVMAWKTAVDNSADERVKFENDLVYQRKASLLRKQNEAYNDFCEKNGLKRLSDRISIAKWDRQQAAAARGAAKRYESAHISVKQMKAILDKNGGGNYNIIRTADEFKAVAEQIRTDITQYVGRESKWSGKINIDNSLKAEYALGQKEWNCDITLIDTADDGTVWHEMLHSCSSSHYDKSVYSANQKIEEASVEFLKQQICKERQIISEQTYGNYTEILEFINDTFGYGSDMEFAQELFNIPLPNRYQWLEDKVDDSLRSFRASFSDYNDIMLYLQQLKGVIL